ncbi:response regulator transcription factor [Candidatus Chlorohelix sp.]|uniref:response regulator transcription factor n=1 Tax=Candidatus Chlorohelix sp. TaxID=3139201 RepID=UPI00303EC8A8
MSAIYHNSTASRQQGHKQKRILIVEDDPRIVDYVSIYCQSEGYEVTHARDGVEALELFKQVQPDFVLLDLMLPRMDGLEVCRQIRITSEVPIIMVTARIDEVDKLLGLETGADDYLTKPFSPRELMARIRVIFRRLEKSPKDEVVNIETEKTLNLGRLFINFDTREVAIDNKIIPSLTNKEFELLTTLAQQPGRVFTKTELEEALYDCDSLVASRAIGVHISNLRAKLPNSHLVETIHGVGYKLSREAV